MQHPLCKFFFVRKVRLESFFFFGKLYRRLKNIANKTTRERRDGNINEKKRTDIYFETTGGEKKRFARTVRRLLQSLYGRQEKCAKPVEIFFVLPTFFDEKQKIQQTPQIFLAVAAKLFFFFFFFRIYTRLILHVS